MQDSLQFVSGLPRAGSTLLMNVLAQNPAHYVTPTSGLIHLMRAVLRTWPDCQEFRAQGLANVKPHVLSGLRGLMLGFFEQPLADGKIVFDKSRGWVSYVEPVEEILGRRVKMIVMVRDVRSIVASLEKAYRRRGIEYRYPSGEHRYEVHSATGRARRTLRTDRVTGRSVLRVRDALARCPDRLLIVPYRRLTIEPFETMQSIHQFLDLPGFEYDFDHVEQVTHEDDNYVGTDLHRIRPQIKPPPEMPWQGMLPEELAEELAKDYADLNRLGAGPVIRGAHR